MFVCMFCCCRLGKNNEEQNYKQTVILSVHKQKNSIVFNILPTKISYYIENNANSFSFLFLA